MLRKNPARKSKCNDTRKLAEGFRTSLYAPAKSTSNREALHAYLPGTHMQVRISFLLVRRLHATAEGLSPAFEHPNVVTNEN